MIADHPNWVAADVAARLGFVEESTVPNTESPMMNSASNLISFNDAMRQRRTCMWARIVDGKERSGNVEYPVCQLINQNHSGTADWDITHLTNVDKFWHIFGLAVKDHQNIERD